VLIVEVKEESMKKKSILFVSVCILVIAMIVSGCSNGGGSGSGDGDNGGGDESATESVEDTGSTGDEATGGETKDTYKIGFLVQSADDQFVTYMLDEAEAFAAEHPEVEYHPGDGKQDSATQISLVENWVTQGFDAICIQPVDSTIGPTFNKLCNDAGIPLVYFNIPADDMEKSAVAYVGCDETLFGQEQGAYLAEQAGEKGGAVIIQGLLGAENVNMRTGGAESSLKAAGVEVIAVDTAKWMRENAMKLMENWLQKYGDEIAIVCANNDEMALGAAQALQAAGRTDVLVGGIDATPFGLDGLKSGELAVSVFQPAQKVAGGAMEIALDAAKNGAPEYFEDWIPPEVVTKDNADDYYQYYPAQ
jgi:inositol transport system substrate-binding protein